MDLKFSVLMILLIGLCVANETPLGRQFVVSNNIISQKLFSAVGVKNKQTKAFSASTAHINKENPPLGSTISEQKPTDDVDAEEKKNSKLDLRDVWKNVFGVRDPLTYLATRRVELGFEVPEDDDGTGEKKVPPLDLRKVWKNTFGVRDPITYISERRDEMGYE